ncbi:MAG TPA: tyrosine-type recombinase/integrase [Jiangellaceae bacterium]|nr:tyrosine-type recombinase/integrase [Jiangellaceae bacterium]
MKAAEIAKGEWFDPDVGRVPLGEYAAQWIAERPLSRRTIDKYERLLRLHVVPDLGSVELVDVTPVRVRAWRAGLLAADVGESTVAQAYRLLRAVLNTALDDELIRGRNPCRIKGADKERAAERPTASVEQVYAIADAIKPWHRALVLTAALTGLRWGELMGLRRRHVDVANGFVEVRAALVEDGRELTLDRTKSEAGVRVVGLPAVIEPELRAHLDRWSEPGPNGRVFVGPKGATPRRSNFNRAWSAAITRAEGDGTAMPEGLRFHDLRHTANGFAADAASLKELMTRMGHSTARAALIYQHARRDREKEIAATVSARVEDALRKRSR